MFFILCIYSLSSDPSWLYNFQIFISLVQSSELRGLYIAKDLDLPSFLSVMYPNFNKPLQLS